MRVRLRVKVRVRVEVRVRDKVRVIYIVILQGLDSSKLSKKSFKRKQFQFYN